MKELLLSVSLLGGISAAADVLLPEGRFHGFARLLSGLWLILILCRSISGASIAQEIFSWDYSPTEWSAEAAQKEETAKILVEEERLLSEKIWEEYGVHAGVRVREDGSVESVTVSDEVSEGVKEEIRAEFGVEELRE